MYKDPLHTCSVESMLTCLIGDDYKHALAPSGSDRDHKTARQSSATSLTGYNDRSRTQHRGISVEIKSRSPTARKDRPQVKQQSKRSSDDCRV